MSVGDELNWRPATELARLIRSKAVGPVELLQNCLETIERLNPKINAICTLAAESVLFAAGIIARCIAVAMKLRGGRKSVSIRLPWLAPFG